MDEHIIPLKQTLKEQQKQIDEQKEMISKQGHLVVQRIQEEQHLKSSFCPCFCQVFCDEDSVGIIFEISFGVIHFFATSV
jgi:hypothetical protein